MDQLLGAGDTQKSCATVIRAAAHHPISRGSSHSPPSPSKAVSKSTVEARDGLSQMVEMGRQGNLGCRVLTRLQAWGP